MLETYVAHLRLNMFGVHRIAKSNPLTLSSTGSRVRSRPETVNPQLHPATPFEVGDI